MKVQRIGMTKGRSGISFATVSHIPKECRVDFIKIKCYNCNHIEYIKNTCLALGKGRLGATNYQIVMAYALEIVPSASH